MHFRGPSIAQAAPFVVVTLLLGLAAAAIAAGDSGVKRPSFERFLDAVPRLDRCTEKCFGLPRIMDSCRPFHLKKR